MKYENVYIAAANDKDIVYLSQFVILVRTFFYFHCYDTKQYNPIINEPFVKCPW